MLSIFCGDPYVFLLNKAIQICNYAAAYMCHGDGPTPYMMAPPHTCVMVKAPPHTCVMVMAPPHTCVMVMAPPHTCVMVMAPPHTCVMVMAPPHTCVMVMAPPHTCVMVMAPPHTCVMVMAPHIGLDVFASQFLLIDLNYDIMQLFNNVHKINSSFLMFKSKDIRNQ